jgi:hypothetical protein
MAETGFDYKKGLGSFLDSNPWYFHFKFALPEDAYFKYMPALALGGYDLGTRSHRTNYDIWYFKVAKTLSAGKINLGRFSVGAFKGNSFLLRNSDGLRDDRNMLVCWERTISEISDKLWVAVDYQGTQSLYGTLNFGFAWKFTNNLTAILAYDKYNNHNYTDTVTLQIDIDF